MSCHGSLCVASTMKAVCLCVFQLDRLRFSSRDPANQAYWGWGRVKDSRKSKWKFRVTRDSILLGSSCYRPFLGTPSVLCVSVALQHTA